MNKNFSITYKEVNVSWSIDAADYLKRKKGFKIVDKVVEFLLSLDGEKEKEKTGVIRCSRCGKCVSSKVPEGTIVKAFIECPECVDKYDTS